MNLLAFRYRCLRDFRVKMAGARGALEVVSDQRDAGAVGAFHAEEGTGARLGAAPAHRDIADVVHADSRGIGTTQRLTRHQPAQIAARDVPKGRA
jgi:hypothetical protein